MAPAAPGWLGYMILVSDSVLYTHRAAGWISLLVICASAVFDIFFSFQIQYFNEFLTHSNNFHFKKKRGVVGGESS